MTNPLRDKLAEIIRQRNDTSDAVWDARITMGHARAAADAIMANFDVSEPEDTDG